MAKNTSIFEAEFVRLNPRQREAVEAVEGPVMVMAGPGTGKTQILALRVANILRLTQVNPENILSITFTKSGASNMVARLKKIIGEAANHVNVFTFHSFCEQVINKEKDTFISFLQKSLATESAKFEILENIIAQGEFKFLKPLNAPDYYVKTIISKISTLKKEGVDCELYAKIVAQEKDTFESNPDKFNPKKPGELKTAYKKLQETLDKNSELVTIYAAYEEQLQAQKLYDYEDLILGFTKKLQENETFRFECMEKYQYILVDEHQDSNNSQNTILSLLTAGVDEPNIFVVGDIKQAIYRFSGATDRNFANFKELYPTAKIIDLTDNYRSSGKILECAFDFLEIPHDNHLRASGAHSAGGELQIDVWQTAAAELEGVAQKVKSLLDSGQAAAEVAVIVRNNAQVRDVCNALTALKIPISFSIHQKIFEDQYVMQLLKLLDCLGNFGDEKKLFELMQSPVLALDPLAVFKIMQHSARVPNGNLFEVCRNLPKLQEVIKNSVSATKIYETYKLLEGLHAKAKVENLHDFLVDAIKTTSILKQILKSTNPILAMEPLNKLFQTIESLSEGQKYLLQDFYQYKERLNKYNTKIDVEIKLQDENKVRVLTAHGSKGLEFEHVFLPMATNKTWGAGVVRDLLKLPSHVFGAELAEDDSLRDEMRLFFVALTRAKKYIHASYSLQDKQGEERELTEFLQKVKDKFKIIEHKEVIQVAVEQDLLPKKINEWATNLEFKTFVQDTFLRYGLSVSALNNYLECPYKYLYTNLLKIPFGKQPAAQFGTAVHSALSAFFNVAKNGNLPALEYLTLTFETSLKKVEMLKTEYDAYYKKGTEILSAYYQKWIGVDLKNIWVAKRIRDVELQAAAGGQIIKIPLNGELDLALFTDNTFKVVSVIDFKTGKAKSRNEILGQTKNADGNYYRQIVFYKLLLKYFDPNIIFKAGVIDFVQPKENGEFASESFDVQDTEVLELETTIKRVASEIQSMQFLGLGCNKHDCESCARKNSLEEQLVVGGLF